MHHRPSGPPLSARLRAAVSLPAGVVRRHVRRLALAVVVATAVTVAVLAVPVVSAPDEGPSSVALDASSSRSPSAGSTSGRSAGGSESSTGAPESSTSAFPGTTPPPAPAAGTSAGSIPETPAAPAPVAAPADEPPSSPSATGTAAAPAPSRSDAPTTARSESPSAPRSSPTTTPPSSGSGTPARAPAPAAVPGPAAPTTTAAATAAGLTAESEVLALVNDERRRAGCGALSADDGLAAVARAHSADMRDQDFFDHVNLAGLDPFARATAAGVAARAENIARGQGDASAVMTSWMSSPGHRANILDCDLDRLGVGMVDGSDGPYWTQLFG